jgi:hypothetical protein
LGEPVLKKMAGKQKSVVHFVPLWKVPEVCESLVMNPTLVVGCLYDYWPQEQLLGHAWVK